MKKVYPLYRVCSRSFVVLGNVLVMGLLLYGCSAAETPAATETLAPSPSPFLPDYPPVDVTEEAGTEGAMPTPMPDKPTPQGLQGSILGTWKITQDSNTRAMILQFDEDGNYQMVIDNQVVNEGTYKIINDNKIELTFNEQTTQVDVVINDDAMKWTDPTGSSNWLRIGGPSGSSKHHYSWPPYSNG